MPWIKEEQNLVQYSEPKTYWIPDVLPESTQKWNSQQSNKTYLKQDGSVISHPGWYFGNTAFASDEYFYHNNGWFTIVDERPEETDDAGNSYIIVETPSNEWEIFDEYKVRKVYKKYLHIKKEKPEYKFGINVDHHFDFNDEDMTATDVYIENSLNTDDLKILSDDIMVMIRKIRNYVLGQTDYLIIISKEKNMVLSEEFINYRQILRDIPETLDFNSLLESDVVEINQLSLSLGFNFSMEGKKDINIDEIKLSFFPQKPNNIFE
jgi:hypothetical protein